MAGPSGGRARRAKVPGTGVSFYVDAGTLAKLHVPVPESETLDAFLRSRCGLMISELAITEVLSAVARRRRERLLRARDAVRIRDAVLADAVSGAFTRLELNPAVHREAERLLLATDSLRYVPSTHCTSHSRFPGPRVTC